MWWWWWWWLALNFYSFQFAHFTTWARARSMVNWTKQLQQLNVMEKELESTGALVYIYYLEMQVDSLIKSLRSVISFYDFSSFSIIRFYSSSICWHHYWQCRINIYTYISAYMYSHIKPSQEEKNKREKQTEMNGHKRITNFCILMLNQMW